MLARFHFPDLAGWRGHLVLQLVLMHNIGGSISVLAHSHLALLYRLALLRVWCVDAALCAALDIGILLPLLVFTVDHEDLLTI